MEMSQRNYEIDVIKGTLVILMIIFHSASMANNKYTDLKIVTIYLGWLHYAFILISGFLCGWYYQPKIENNRYNVRARVKNRGYKLLLVFFTINAILYFSGFMEAFSLDLLKSYFSSARNIFDNFILEMNGRLVGFQIIYYIGIFLIVTSFILGRFGAFFLFLLILLIFFFIQYSRTLFFLEFGFFGFYFGIIWNSKRFIKIKTLIPVIIYSSPLFLLIELFLLFNKPIFIYKNHHILLLYHLIQILFWFGFALLFSKIFLSTRIAKWILSLFSKYTLLSYILQMLIIRIGFVFITKLQIVNYNYFFVNIVFSSTILFFTILFIDNIRRKIKIADVSYRFIFG